MSNNIDGRTDALEDGGGRAGDIPRLVSGNNYSTGVRMYVCECACICAIMWEFVCMYVCACACFCGCVWMLTCARVCQCRRVLLLKVEANTRRRTVAGTHIVEGRCVALDERQAKAKTETEV